MRVFFAAGTNAQRADEVTSGSCLGCIPRGGPRVILRAERQTTAAGNIASVAEAPLSRDVLNLVRAKVLPAMRLGGS